MPDLLPLCCPADVRGFTNVDRNFTGLDNSLKSYITTVSSQVRNFTRRDFLKKERTEYFMSKSGGNGPQDIQTIEDNVDPLAPFVVYYSPIGDFRVGQAYIVPAADMLVDYETGKITLNGWGYELARKGFCVKYTGGYSPTNVEGYDLLDVPDVLRRACAMQCASMLNKTRAGALGKSSASQGNSGVTDTWDRGGMSGLIREVTGALQPFRRKLVGRT